MCMDFIRWICCNWVWGFESPTFNDPCGPFLDNCWKLERCSTVWSWRWLSSKVFVYYVVALLCFSLPNSSVLRLKHDRTTHYRNNGFMFKKLKFWNRSELRCRSLQKSCLVTISRKDSAEWCRLKSFTTPTPPGRPTVHYVNSEYHAPGRQSVSNKQQQSATSSNSIHAKHFRPDKESTSAGRSWNEWQKSGNAAWQKLGFGIIYAISPPHRLWLALVEQYAGSRLELQLNFSL